MHLWKDTSTRSSRRHHFRSMCAPPYYSSLGRKSFREFVIGDVAVLSVNTLTRNTTTIFDETSHTRRVVRTLTYITKKRNARGPPRAGTARNEHPSLQTGNPTLAVSLPSRTQNTLQKEKRTRAHESRHPKKRTSFHPNWKPHLGDVLAGHLRPGVPQVVRLGVSVLVLLHILLRPAKKKRRTRTNMYVYTSIMYQYTSKYTFYKRLPRNQADVKRHEKKTKRNETKGNETKRTRKKNEMKKRQTYGISIAFRTATSPLS